MNKKLVALGMSILCAICFTGCGKPKVENKAMELKIAINLGGEINKEIKYEPRQGVYTGEVDKDNLPDGLGKFETQNKQGKKWYYEGSFVKGRFEGKGKTVWPELNLIREGSYKSGLLNGEGKVTNPHGLNKVYEGNFVNGNLHGKGKITDKDGKVEYEGEFDNWFPVNKTDLSGEATDIAADFARNEVGANARYKDKIVEITGEIMFIGMPNSTTEKDKKISDQRLIVFKGHKYQRGNAYVCRAFFYENIKDNDMYARIRKGNIVTAKGYFRGSNYYADSNFVGVDIVDARIVNVVQ